jgi:hypothetical protein
MDKTRIIQQGEEAKFQVQIKDFDMEANDFSVELIYGYRRTTVTIEKAQMLENGGLYYIIFDTDGMVGRVTARCTWHVPDTDAPDGYREKTDEQYLCFVVTTPCPQFLTCPACTDEHLVTYTRTEQSDISEKYQRLADCYDRPLLTVDDEYIFVLKPNN